MLSIKLTARIRSSCAGVLGALAPVPIRRLPRGRRAKILEALVDEMVSTVKIGNDEILMYTPFPTLIWRAETLLTKELDTIRWIDEFDEGSVFWDVGANVGVYSLYAAVKRHTRVLAFEPVAANFYALTKNVHLNGLGDRIATYCLALSEVIGLGVVNLSSATIGYSLHQYGKPGARSPYADPNSLQMMHGSLGFTVDGFVEQFAPPFPNHIKIDVDGLELAILSGSSRTLIDPRLKSVLVELSNTSDETEKAVRMLHQGGFQLVASGDIQTAGEKECANYLFRKLP